MTLHSESQRQAQRKNEHLAIAEKLWRQRHENWHPVVANIRLRFPSLPEMGEDDLHLAGSFNQQPYRWPILINAMTGGTEKAAQINAKLAAVAHAFNLPMALGSASIIKRIPDSLASFAVVREIAPEIPLFVNFGVSQDFDLIYTVAKKLKATALQIHLNVEQELVMPEGDRNFKWQSSLEQLILKSQSWQLPLILKGVGRGLELSDLESKLPLEHISGLDIAGRGGTDFITVENERRSSPFISDFSQWGYSTEEMLIMAAAERSRLPRHLIASGGITTPLEAITSLAMGADLVGMSTYFLHLALHLDVADMIDQFAQWLEEFSRLFIATGCASPQELKTLPILIAPSLQGFANSLNLNWPALQQHRL